MDKQALSDAQYAQLVDTLQRWGLDSPELIAELADHYAEKCLELMGKGYSWEQVLGNMKTKKTYRELRRMQAAYEAYAKKSAGSLLLLEMKAALHPQYLVPVLALGYLSYWLMQSAHTVAFVQYALLSKNLLVLAAMMYFIDFNRRTKQVLSDANLYFGWLIIMDVVLFSNHSTGFVSEDNFLTAMQAAQKNMAYVALAVTISFYLNVVMFRIIKSIRRRMLVLPDEVFEKSIRHGKS